MSEPYEIVPATDLHIGPHVAHLSDEDREEIAKTGLPPRRLIRSFLHQSSYARAAIVRGVPVALWGVVGASMESTGYVWLSVAPEARARRFALLKETIRQLREIGNTKVKVVSAISCDDTKALRFADALGFQTEEHQMSLSGREFYQVSLKI